MSDALSVLYVERDAALQRCWDAVEKHLESLIDIGQAMAGAEHPLKCAKEAGLSNRTVRLARLFSCDPERTREAFRRCLARAMKRIDALSVHEVADEINRLAFRSAFPSSRSRPTT